MYRRILFLFPLLIISLRMNCQTIKIVTEEYPPYNYLKNGIIVGLSTDVVNAVLKITKMKSETKIYPWTKAYDKALREKNTLIYSIGKTSERETNFKWVGVIAPYDVYIYKLKNRKDIDLKNLKDAKKFKIATTIDDVRERYLLNNGFMMNEHLLQSPSNEQNLIKLQKGKVDLWPISELVAVELIKKHKNKNQEIVKAFHIADLSSEGLYMAFNKDTSEEIVNKFRMGLEKIKSNGTYSEILKKYNIKEGGNK